MQNGQLAPRAISHGIRNAIAFGRRAGVAAWAFLSSRRWLVVAMLATCALIAVLTLGQPKHLLVPQEPEAPEVKFDDVKNFGVASGSSGSWFRRGAPADVNADKAANQVPGLILSAPADESELPESARLTRRLDAVRSRQNKGAWLTGKIDSVNKLARQSSNAPLRPPVRVLPQRTADSSSTSLHSTPESVFR
ncbi:MAG TPA: hypothetical protein VFG04_19685 [Planctomycetaceae bacterium]|nr:hypothetical protein [Planctomycetaceae bacterium]